MCSQLWMSKNRIYENPYNIKGIIELTGSHQKPKDICKDSDNGTRKAQDVESF